MAEPIRLVDTAFALLDGPRRPEIGDVVTIALRGTGAFEVDATVASLEITDEEGEIAVLVMTPAANGRCRSPSWPPARPEIHP